MCNMPPGRFLHSSGHDCMCKSVRSGQYCMADTNESDTGMPQVGSQDHFRLATFVLLLFGADTPHTRMGLESSLCGRPKPLPDFFFFSGTDCVGSFPYYWVFPVWHKLCLYALWIRKTLSCKWSENLPFLLETVDSFFKEGLMKWNEISFTAWG